MSNLPPPPPAPPQTDFTIRGVVVPKGYGKAFVVGLVYNAADLVMTAVKETVGRDQAGWLYFTLEGLDRIPEETLDERILRDFMRLVQRPIPGSAGSLALWTQLGGVDHAAPSEPLHLLIVRNEEYQARVALGPIQDPTLLRRLPGLTARAENLSTLASLPTPSECAKKPQELYERNTILAGRPYGSRGPPIAIYEPILGRLAANIRDLRSAHPNPRPDMVDWASELCRDVINISSMEDVMEDVLEKAMRLKLEIILPSPRWQVELAGGKIKGLGLGWMWELKKNRGLSGDPEAQVIAGYQKVLADPTTQYGRLRHKSRLPTILISQAGAQFDISVAVDVEYLLVDHLFSVNLHDGVNLREDIKTMARLATCLQDTSHELHAYYTDLLDNPGGHASPEFLTGLHLPNPELTVPVKLLFLERLSRATSMPVDGNRPSDKAANARYALFLATLLNDSASKEVVVKFSETYNADAHKMLAEIGLAPALHYSEPITGGLVMTVMDRIDGRTAYQLSLLPNGETCPLPRFVYDDVERAILKLREKTLVFGDLRLPNIMVPDEEFIPEVPHDDGASTREPESTRGKRSLQAPGDTEGPPAKRRHVKVHAMLIDFDWAGPDGVARYPSTKSTGPEWSTDARACGLMREAHDSWCLKVIQRACLSA